MVVLEKGKKIMNGGKKMEDRERRKEKWMEVR